MAAAGLTTQAFRSPATPAGNIHLSPGLVAHEMQANNFRGIHRLVHITIDRRIPVGSQLLQHVASGMDARPKR